MSDSTHIDLREGEDVAARFGRSPDLEARFAGDPLGLELVAFGAPRSAGEHVAKDAEVLPDLWSG